MALFQKLRRQQDAQTRNIGHEKRAQIRQALRNMPAEHRLALARELEAAHAEAGGGGELGFPQGGGTFGEGVQRYNPWQQMAEQSGMPFSGGQMIGGQPQYTELVIIPETSVATTASTSTTTAAPPGLFWCQRMILTQVLAAGGPGSGGTITSWLIGGQPILQGTSILADGYGAQSRYIRELNRWIFTSQPTSLAITNNSTGTLLIGAYYQGYLFLPAAPPPFMQQGF